MFIFDDNGLLASKKQQQTQDKTAQNLSRFKGVAKLDRDKELSNLEEQTDLLKKIYRSSGRGFNKKSSTSSLAKDLTKKATIGAIGGVVAGVLKKLLKKGGILAPFLTNTDKAKKQYAKEEGLFVEDLGLKDRLKSLVVTLGDSVVGVVNNALSALGIDYQLPKGKVKELIDTIDNKMGEIFQNFVDNTGTFGKELQSFLNSTDSFLGKTLENAKTQFRMLTDVFMKQSKDWKEFIKVVKEADALEGMKGYVSDKDKAKYDKLRKRATELAKKLQNNKDFVEHSGYQVIAKNLLNPAKKAKIDNQMAKNKVDDKNSLITQGVGVLTGKQVTIDDKLKAKKEEEQTYIKYVQEKRKHYNITDAEQKRYNQIVANKNSSINEQIKNLDKSKEIALLDKAIKINSDMMIKDAQHKEIYQKNIEEADKRRKELLKQQDENTKKIADLQKQLMKPIADTKAVGSNAYDEAKTTSSDNNKVGSNTNNEVGSKKPRSYNTSTTRLRGKEWLEQLKANAQVVGREIGIDPKIIMAQQIQENGWKGKKLTGKNNFFNIKAGRSWKGAKSAHRVWEIRNGKKVWENAYFRDYEDPTQSAKDYANLIKRNYGYALKYRNNPNLYIKTIAKKYATDPNYAKNIINIYKSRKLNKIFNTPSTSNNIKVVKTENKKSLKETMVASKVSKKPTTKVAQQQNTTSNNKQTVVVKTDNSDIISAINNQTKVLTKNNKTTVTPSNQTTVAYTPSRQALSNG